jgi:hypothetical protein
MGEAKGGAACTSPWPPGNPQEETNEAMIQNGPSDGVIKYGVRSTKKELPHQYEKLARDIESWRHILILLGHVGMDPQRYQGVGFGNLSARIEGTETTPTNSRFLITGSQTGGKPCLSLDDYCLVEEYDIINNSVVSTGLLPPSSEAMTHGMIYDCFPEAKAVFHSHAPEIWRHAADLDLPCTGPEVPYGTVQMAQEIRRLACESSLRQSRVLAMLGHEDGVSAFGRTPAEVGQLLVVCAARGHAAEMLAR